jgi:hypothetical protein
MPFKAAWNSSRAKTASFFTQSVHGCAASGAL